MDPPAHKDQGRSVAAAPGINDAPPTTDSALREVAVSPTAVDDLGPSYKDQASSVAISRQSDDKLAMAAAAMASNATPYCGSNVVHVNPRDNQEDAGPTYKDQVNFAHVEAVVHSNPSSQSPKRSNVTSSLSSSVPMVLGVLVPDELLTEEERRLNQETLTASEPENDRSLPTQHGTEASQPPRENVSATQDESKTVQQMKDDMRFWVKLILLAIFCNTLLVAAVIVGTFCGVGACGSSNSNAVTLPPPLMPPSNVPSTAPTLSPEFLIGGPVENGTFAPTSNIGTELPTSLPTSLPSRAPTLMPTSDNPPISVGALVAIALVLDILLVAGCVYGYYKWKRRPPETAKSDACIADADVGEESVDPISLGP
jgi:hypothetical protein